MTHICAQVKFGSVGRSYTESQIRCPGSGPRETTSPQPTFDLRQILVILVPEEAQFDTNGIPSKYIEFYFWLAVMS